MIKESNIKSDPFCMRVFINVLDFGFISYNDFGEFPKNLFKKMLFKIAN